MSATGPWGSASYSYDPLNNLRNKALGSASVQLNYDGQNRMHQFRDSRTNGNNRQSVAYDARGNVTDSGTASAGGLRFTYDMANQPISMMDAATGSFVYDGNLKRAKQVINGKTIYTMYGQSGAILYRDNVTDAKVTDYIRMGGATIAEITNGVVTYLYADHLGSPVKGAQGANVTWSENYTPFGEKWTTASQQNDGLGYTGHITDTASGLTYMQARYYNPVWGRFLANVFVRLDRG